MKRRTCLRAGIVDRHARRLCVDATTKCSAVIGPTPTYSPVKAEEALVTGADKTATNGLVHVIDRVLLPPAK